MRRFFLSIMFLSLFLFVMTAFSVHAAEENNYKCNFISASGLLGSNGSIFTSQNCEPKDLVSFINTLDTFFYRLAIVLAVLMITIGGMQWLMAIGNSGKVGNAKETIQQAVIGLILAFTAILLFNQIDASFTNLKTIDIGVKDKPEVACGEIQGAVQCAAGGLRGCYWTPKNEDNFFGEGKCGFMDCSTIKKCEQYPPDKNICEMNDKKGFCNLQLKSRELFGVTGPAPICQFHSSLNLPLLPKSCHTDPRVNT